MSLTVDVSLADQVRKLNQGASDVPAEVNASLGEARLLQEKMQKYATDVAAIKQTTQEQLGKLGPAESAFRADMAKHQKDIDTKVTAAEDDLHGMRSCIDKSQHEIAEALQLLKTRVAELNTHMVSLKDVLKAAADAQGQAIEAGIGQIKTAQNLLSVASRKADDQVVALQATALTATTEEKAQVQAVSESLAAAQERVRRSVDDFEAQAKAAANDLTAKLPEIQKATIGRRTDANEKQIQHSLQVDVLKVSQDSADRYTAQAILLMAHQVDRVDQQVKEKDDPYEKIIKDLQGGPLLPPMLVRAKLVLQKIAQGPAAGFLQEMASLGNLEKN